MRNLAKLGNVTLVGFLVLIAPMGAAEINFEGLPAGTVVFQVSTGLGVTGALSGTIQVFGFNPAFGPGTNAAVIFDSSTQPGKILISVRRTKLSVGPESGSEDRCSSLSRTARPGSISS